MKTKIIFLAVLSCFPALAWAQVSYTGTIARPAQGLTEGPEIAPEQPRETQQRTVGTNRKYQVAREIEVSRNPKDMNDMEGMDAYEVFTWTDGNGVRHFTDDARKAPASARRRNVYSVPPSGDVYEYRYTQDDVLYIYED